MMGETGDVSVQRTATDSRTAAEAGEKRVRTAWRLRRRFRLAQRAAALTGMALGLGIVRAAAASLPDPSVGLGRGFLASSALLVLSLAALPWLVVGSLWQRVRRRHGHEWTIGALHCSRDAGLALSAASYYPVTVLVPHSGTRELLALPPEGIAVTGRDERAAEPAPRLRAVG